MKRTWTALCAGALLALTSGVAMARDDVHFGLYFGAPGYYSAPPPAYYPYPGYYYDYGPTWGFSYRGDWDRDHDRDRDRHHFRNSWRDRGEHRGEG